jgi:hypothetical protein
MAQTTVAINLEAKTKGTESVKSLKAQIREATQEALALSQKFGEFSPEALKAAQRVAQLKDEMGDFKQRVEALNPDKFDAIGKVVGGVASGFSAAQGAMALFGAESEDVQKALLKVQGAMAFAQGIQGVLDARNQFVALGKSAVASFKVMSGASKAFMVGGIGLLITGITLVIQNWDKLKEKITGTNAVQEKLNQTTEAYRDGAKEAIIATNQVEVAFKQAKDGVISKEKALKIYNEQLGDVLGVQTDLNKAEKVFIENAGTYVESVAKRKQIDELLTKAAEAEAEARMDAQQAEVGFFSDQGSKQLNESYLRRQRAAIIARGKEKAQSFKDAASQLVGELSQLQKAHNLKTEKTETNQKKTEDNYQQHLDDLRNKTNQYYKDTEIIEEENENKKRRLQLENQQTAAELEIKDQIFKLQEKEKLNQRETILLRALNENLIALQAKHNAERFALEEDISAKEKAKLEQNKKEQQDFVKQKNDSLLKANDTYYKAVENKLIQSGANQAAFDALEIERLEANIEAQKALFGENSAEVIAAENELVKKKKDIYDKDVKAKEESEKAKQEAQMATVNEAANAISALGGLLKEGSDAAKAAALIDIAIKTGVGFAQGLDIAQKGAAGTGPAAPYAFPIFYAQQIAAVLGAVSRAKSILKGGSGGGGTGGGVSATPSAPTFTPITGGALPDEQQFGGMGRVYVLEGDITKTQIRVRRLRNTSVV